MPDLDLSTAHQLPLPLRPRVNLAAVAARYRAMAETPTTDALRRTAIDVPALVSEVDRLTRTLVRTRLRYANLVAAARATLAAHRDGNDPDPLGYLRDELPGSAGERR